MKKLKIAFLMSRRDPLLPLLDNDGGGILLFGYGFELAKLGHYVDIYTSRANMGWGETDYVEKKRAAQDKDVVCINNRVRVIRKDVAPINVDGNGNFNSCEHKIMSSISFSNSFGDNELSDYEIVNICHPTTGYGLLKSGKIDPQKTTLFPMLLSCQYEKYRYVSDSYKQMEDLVLSSVGSILFASHEEESDLASLGVDLSKAHFIARGVDKAIFAGRLRKSASVAINIISVGAIRSQKNYLLFVDIAKILAMNKINFVVNIAGDNVNFSYDENKLYYENMLEIINREGLGDYIKFIGGVNQNELTDIIGGADLAVFPSLSESFGKAMLETVASGLPTVLSNSVEAYKTFAADGVNSVLVDPNAEAFSSAILRLVNDQKLYAKISKNGLKIADSFTWEKVTKDLLKFYSQLLKEV